MYEEFDSSLFLIRNKTDKEQELITFIEELQEVELVARSFLHARLWTDTYAIWPRNYPPNSITEVKFVVAVSILGRMMNKIPQYGELPSFSYLKIRDGKSFLLPNGERIEDPYTVAIRAATEFFKEN